ncbi:MAG: LamG-like jellyroll fold domain-containing protein [Opitutales bacterium]
MCFRTLLPLTSALISASLWAQSSDVYLGVTEDFTITVDQGTAGLDAGDTVTWRAGQPEEVAGLTFETDATSDLANAQSKVAAGGTLHAAGRIYSGDFPFESGKSLKLYASTTFSGNVTLTAGATLELDHLHTLELTGSTLTGFDAGTMALSVLNADGLREGSSRLIHWKDVTTSSDVDLTDFSLTAPALPGDATFRNYGPDLRLSRPFYISTAAQLSEAFKPRDARGSSGSGLYGNGAIHGDTLSFQNDIILDRKIYPVQRSVTIEGNGFTLDGQDLYHGLFLLGDFTGGRSSPLPGSDPEAAPQDMQVTVRNLTIQNCLSKGGDGFEGGGGGAGLGGAIFVNEGIELVISGVVLEGNKAEGGQGGILDSGLNYYGGGGGLLNGQGYHGGGGGFGSSSSVSARPSDGLGFGGKGGGSADPDEILAFFGHTSDLILGGYDGGEGGNNEPSGDGSGAGGGLGGEDISRVSLDSGDGGDGGFGGGGGRGIGSSDVYGGNGGFGGGGGMASSSGNSYGGDGGFGGGGAGYGQNWLIGGGGSQNGTAGTGGFGASNGSLYGGGPGASLGGALFLHEGATLTLSGSLDIGENSAPRTIGDLSGYGFGSGIFLHGNQTQALSPPFGETIEILGSIADMDGSTYFGKPNTASHQGSAGIVFGGPGTVILHGEHTYSGTTTLSGGTLDLRADLLKSELTVEAAGTLVISDRSTLKGLIVEAGSSVSLRLNPSASLAINGGPFELSESISVDISAYPLLHGLPTVTLIDFSAATNISTTLNQFNTTTPLPSGFSLSIEGNQLLLNAPPIAEPDYQSIVLADAPIVYWPMDHVPALATNSDTTSNAPEVNLGNLGSVADGAFRGPIDATSAELLPNSTSGTGLNLDIAGAANHEGILFTVPFEKYPAGSTGFTTEFWLRVTETIPLNAQTNLVGDGETDPSTSFCFMVNLLNVDGTLLLRPHAYTTTGYAFNGDTPIEVGELYHVVSRWDPGTDGGRLDLFVNGVQSGIHSSFSFPNGFDGTGTGTTPDNTGNQMFVGRDGIFPASQGFEIDEVALYNKPLSDDRIRVHYEAGLASEILIRDEDSDGLSNLWELENGLLPDNSADGPANLAAFAFDLSPGALIPTPEFQIDSNGLIEITHPINPQALGLLNIIPEASTDLGQTDPWSPTGLSIEDITNGLRTIRSTETYENEPKDFFRLRVEQPQAAE